MRSIKIPVKLVQQLDKRFFAAIVDAHQVGEICYENECSTDDPDGVNRTVFDNHVDKLKKAFLEGNIFSQAIRVSADEGVEFKRVNKHDWVMVLPSAKAQLCIIDGQHTVRSVYAAAAEAKASGKTAHLLLSVKEFVSVDERKADRANQSIGSLTENKACQTYLRYAAHKLSEVETMAGDLIFRATTDDQTPLFGRILYAANQLLSHKTKVSVSAFNVCIASVRKALSVGQFREKSAEERYTLFVDTLKAWREATHDTWMKPEQYFTSTKYGLQAFLNCMPVIFIKAIQLDGKLTEASVRKAIKIVVSGMKPLDFSFPAQGWRGHYAFVGGYERFIKNALKVRDDDGLLVVFKDSKSGKQPIPKMSKSMRGSKPVKSSTYADLVRKTVEVGGKTQAAPAKAKAYA